MIFYYVNLMYSKIDKTSFVHGKFFTHQPAVSFIALLLPKLSPILLTSSIGDDDCKFYVECKSCYYPSKNPGIVQSLPPFKKTRFCSRGRVSPGGRSDTPSARPSWYRYCLYSSLETNFIPAAISEAGKRCQNGSKNW